MQLEFCCFFLLGAPSGKQMKADQNGLQLSAGIKNVKDVFIGCRWVEPVVIVRQRHLWMWMTTGPFCSRTNLTKENIFHDF